MRNNNKDEIILAVIPIAFAVGGDVSVNHLTMSQIESIYMGKIKNWRELGGQDEPITLVGREPTEAIFSVLKEHYGFFEHAQFDKTFTKDNAVVHFLQSSAGKYAIGFGAAPNFQEIKQVSVSDFSIGVPVGLVYDSKNEDHPIVKAAKDYAQSQEWHDVVAKMGLLSMRPVSKVKGL